jgi:hypothetical protein
LIHRSARLCLARLCRARHWLVCSALALAVGCGGSGQEVIVKTADGRGLTAEDIDRAPLALLPPDGFAWVHIDVTRAAQSSVGQRLLDYAETRVPINAETGFVARRDLTRVVVGAYSLQGVDFAGVASGRFDPERIAQAAKTDQVSARVGRIVESEYAGRKLYTVQNVGFVVLTPHTLLFGNETGIRRSLDRIQEGRAQNELPGWVSELLAAPAAHFVSGFDLTTGPVATAVAPRLAFLRGAQLARVLGNFEPPGVNLAGTITYPDEQAAARGAADLQRQGSNVALAARLLGLGKPIQKLEAQPAGNDAQFVISLDESALDKALGLLSRLEAR